MEPNGNHISFNVVHNDGYVQVRIDDGFATIDVGKIRDREVLVRAFRQALAAGANRGVLFSGEVVNDGLARMLLRRVKHGTAWLGGRITRLEDGEDGPCFRIDLDSMPSITE